MKIHEYETPMEVAQKILSEQDTCEEFAKEHGYEAGFGYLMRTVESWGCFLMLMKDPELQTCEDNNDETTDSGNNTDKE